MIQLKATTLSDAQKTKLKQSTINEVKPLKDISQGEFKKRQKEIIEKLKRGEVIGNSIEEQIAKKQTQVHWIKADIKRAKTNMKHALKNNDIESFNYHKKKLYNALLDIKNAMDIKE